MEASNKYVAINVIHKRHMYVGVYRWCTCVAGAIVFCGVFHTMLQLQFKSWKNTIRNGGCILCVCVRVVGSISVGGYYCMGFEN